MMGFITTAQTPPAPQGASTAQQPEMRRAVVIPSLGEDLRLHVGAVSVRADESQRGAAFAGGEDSFVRFVHVDRSRCGLGTASTEPAQTPRVGWRVEGRVTQRTADGLAVQITWQRIWSEGRRVDGAAGGNLQVTMREGERLRLDTATFDAEPGCDATTVRLEAVVGRGWFSGATGVGAPGGGFGRGLGGGRGRASASASGSGGIAVGGGGSGASATASAGRGGAVASAGGTSVAGGRGGSGGGAVSGASAAASQGRGVGGGGGRGGGGAGAAGLLPRVTDPFDLEIWLVHVPPGGAESVQRVAVEGMPGGTVFEFPLVPISVLSVEISGRVTVVDDAAGKRKLTLFFSRRVVASGSTGGGSAGTRSIEMPAPDDVVSFELPDSDGQSQRLLQGHRFSLRVRIKPSK
jgi:hypothetical protein